MRKRFVPTKPIGPLLASGAAFCGETEALFPSCYGRPIWGAELENIAIRRVSPVAKGPLGDIVAEADAAIIEEAAKGGQRLSI